MGNLATNVIRDIHEALVSEENGAVIDLVPEGCTFTYMGNTRFNLDFPMLGLDNRGLPFLTIIFSEGIDHINYPPIIVEKGKLHHQTTEEEDVLDKVHSWLTTEGKFNVKK